MERSTQEVEYTIIRGFENEFAHFPAKDLKTLIIEKKRLKLILQRNVVYQKKLIDWQSLSNQILIQLL